MRNMLLACHLLWFPAIALSGTPVTPETPVAATVSAGAAATLLRYDAYVGGARVGEARVQVVIDDGAYQIQGSARTLGLLDSFSDWRNRFSAHGEIAATGAEGQTIQPLSFAYLEKDRDQRRQVRVQEGALQVIRNGKVRPALPAPGGLDVLAGLFVLPRCQGDQLLHTGRHHYRLARLESRPGHCRYAVIDDDDDRYEVSVAFTSRGGVIVPRRVVIEGFLTGSVVLREPEVAFRKDADIASLAEVGATVGAEALSPVPPS